MSEWVDEALQTSELNPLTHHPILPFPNQDKGGGSYFTSKDI
jgi:hypothetical protein